MQRAFLCLFAGLIYFAQKLFDMANDNKSQAKQERAVSKAVEKTAKAIEGQLNKALRTQAKLVNENSKAWKASQSVIARAMKGNERLSASYAKTAKELVKLQKAMQGAIAGKSAGGTSRSAGGGIGIGIPAFLSVAAITAATKAMGDYVTSLARTRDMANALGGSFRKLDLPFARDAELFTEFANQNFANRFTGSSAIEGLRQLRDSLAQALGPEAGKSLTLEITKGFGANTEALDEFLAKVRIDLPRALKQFQSVSDIGAMTTALHAVTMESTELSKTAATLEQAWQAVKDQFELLTRDIVDKNGGDIRATINSISQSIVDGINWVRQYGAEWGPVFEFIRNGILELKKVWDFWSGAEKRRVSESYRHQAVQKINNEMARRWIDVMKHAKAEGDTARFERASAEAKKYGLLAEEAGIRAREALNGPDFKPLELKLPQAVEKVTASFNDAAVATKKEREEIEKMLTPAERVAIVLQRLGRDAEFLSGELAVSLAKLSYFESSPLGFGATFGVRLEAIQKITQQLELARKRLGAINSLERQSDDQRKEALSLEEQIYKMMQQRMELQKQLNDGYLDAVQAQAFGAGRFEKILISRDQNLARALEMGAIKANRAVGQVGAAARASDVSPFRFGLDQAENIKNAQKYGEELSKNWMSKGERRMLESLQSIDSKLPAIGSPSPATDEMIRETMSKPKNKGRRIKKEQGHKDAASIFIRAAENMIETARQIRMGAEQMDVPDFGHDGDSSFPNGGSFV